MAEVEKSDRKAALRADMKRLLAQILPDEFEKAGRLAARHLAGCPEYARAGALLLFLPLADEMSTRALAEMAWKDGKVVAVPRPLPEARSMEWLEIERWDEPMRRGAMGVKIPEKERIWTGKNTDFLVVVPGLAFDETGNRLGRGGGYYDRFLSGAGSRAVPVGWSLEAQVVKRVPVDAHDVPVRLLVTESGIRRFPG